MIKDLQITEAGEDDLAPLADFMRSLGSSMKAEDLRHWYWKNPSGSASVIIGRSAGRIVGMATTNDHRFAHAGENVLVAMPQKVLTDPSMRGKGIFGQLYWASEAACRRRGVEFFLTVTNSASTNIFLGKFGYVRLPVPRAIALPPAFGPIKRTVQVHSSADIDGPVPSDPSIWHMVKDEDHYRWRFLDHKDPTHIHLSSNYKGGHIGQVFMKKIKRKGLPIMLMLDVIPIDRKSLRPLIKIAQRATLAHGCIGMLALDRSDLRTALGGVARLDLSSGFNLLVKGHNEEHTQLLATQKFELSFGDLDFF